MNYEIVLKLAKFIDSSYIKSLEQENGSITESALVCLEFKIGEIESNFLKINNNIDRGYARDLDIDKLEYITGNTIDLYESVMDVLEGNLYDVGSDMDIRSMISPIIKNDFSLNVEDKLNRENVNLNYIAIMGGINKFREDVVNIYNKEILPFHEEKSENTAIEFLKTKVHTNEQECLELVMTNNQDFNKVELIEKGSVRTLNIYKGENKIDIKHHHSSYVHYSKNIVENYIDFIFRKRPQIGKLLKKEMIKENYAVERSLLVAENIFQNTQVLKNLNIDLIRLFENTTLEGIDDKISEIRYRHDVNKYSQKIISNKYKDLINESSLEIFKELYDIKIDHKEVQSKIGAKLAGFKTPSDFNQALQRLLNSFNNFDKYSFIEKSKGVNASVVVDVEDKLILKIDDFEASSILGSPSWCISRSENYFNDYTSDNKEQFFVYDFSKKSKDNLSMIGITLHPGTHENKFKYKYSTAHSKDDSYHRVDNCVQIINEIDKTVQKKKTKPSP